MRREIKRKGNNEKGFTLLEMMIVVAIIAVLVVISIPVFTGVLEKSREATDLANVRSAYAEVMIAAITQDTSSSLYDSTLSQYRKEVNLAQKLSGWETEESELNIGGVAATDKQHWVGTPVKGGKCTVIYSALTDEVFIKWSGYTVATDNQWGQTDDGKFGLINRNYLSNWPASAVNETIDAKTGQKVVIKEITEDEFPNLYKYINEQGGGYEIGVFLLDSKGNYLADNGAKYISNSTGLTIELDPTKTKGWEEEYKIESDKDVKLAIQFFKMKSGSNHSLGSVKMTQAEAEELERIFEITD
jgi:prepilin-type N-terminal cleavage/methylation domain-containing protein